MNKLKNQKGITLVELVIGIAIMMVLVVVVGSVVITSSKSYKASTTQTILISEASNTKNQIINMIMDATDAVAVLSATNTGNDLEMNRQGEKYILQYREDEEKLYVVSEDREELLAEYVTGFEVDDSDYEDNRTVSFKVIFTFENMSYDIDFQATSRNEKASDSIKAEKDPYFKISHKELYLEPNQDYILAAKLVGGSGKYNVSVIDSTTFADKNDSKRTKIAVDADKVNIHIGRNEFGNDSATMFLKFTSEDQRDGAPIASAVVTIRIRRVTDIKASLHLVGGEPGLKGSIYEATGFCFGTNLEKINTNDNRTDVDPKAIFGEFTFWVKGQKVNMFEYFDIVMMNARNARIEFKKDMPEESELRVQVIAQHPKGGVNNISGIEYGYFEDILVMKKPDGSMPPIVADENFARGKEYFIKAKNGDFLHAESNILYGLGYGNAIVNSDVVKVKNWIYRFREIKDGEYGEWVPFRSTVDKGLYAKLNNNETMRFLPDKCYEVQFVYAAFDPYQHILYYPVSDELLNQKGFTDDDGKKLYKAGWNSKQSQMEESQYVASTFYVLPVEVTLEDVGAFKNLTFIGTSKQPKIIKVGSAAEFKIYTSYLDDKNILDILLQVPGEGYNWNTPEQIFRVEKTVTENGNKYSKVRIDNLRKNMVGRYRYLIGINWPLLTNGDKLEEDFSNFWAHYAGNKYYPYYEHDTGKGFIFFNIEE